MNFYLAIEKINSNVKIFLTKFKKTSEATHKCIQNFAQMNELIKCERKPKEKQKWSEERKLNRSQDIKDSMESNTKYDNISPLKSRENLINF